MAVTDTLIGIIEAGLPGERRFPGGLVTLHDGNLCLTYEHVIDKMPAPVARFGIPESDGSITWGSPTVLRTAKPGYDPSPVQFPDGTLWAVWHSAGGRGQGWGARWDGSAWLPAVKVIGDDPPADQITTTLIGGRAWMAYSVPTNGPGSGDPWDLIVREFFPDGTIGPRMVAVPEGTGSGKAGKQMRAMLAPLPDGRVLLVWSQYDGTLERKVVGRTAPSPAGPWSATFPVMAVAGFDLFNPYLLAHSDPYPLEVYAPRVGVAVKGGGLDHTWSTDGTTWAVPVNIRGPAGAAYGRLVVGRHPITGATIIVCSTDDGASLGWFSL